MADRTESSITVDAPPAEVMAVIADFDAYPQWTGAVKETEVRSKASNGRAKEVWFNLDAGAIKDQYTLAYSWKGDSEVRWQLVEAEHVVGQELEEAQMRALAAFYAAGAPVE